MTNTDRAASHTARTERRLGDWLQALVRPGYAEFVMVVVKQGWVSLLGALLLLGLIVTDAI